MSGEYRMTHRKRNWVPEWLFWWASAFNAVTWFPPLRWALTVPVDDPDGRWIG